MVTPPIRPAVRVTVAQIGSSTDREANRLICLDALALAAERHSDVVIFPEYAAAFEPAGMGAAYAEPLDGPFVSSLRKRAAAHRLTVIAGTLVPGQNGKAQNTVVVVGPDGRVGAQYVKVHLYDAFGQRESQFLEPGDPRSAPVVVSIAGMQFGVMTCYDVRFPEQARRLVDAGAQVLVVPAAWAAGELKELHWRTLNLARAIENTCAVVAVGQAGPGTVGRSLVVGPDGAVGLELSGEPEIRTVDIDPSELQRVRELNPSLLNRRYQVVAVD